VGTGREIAGSGSRDQWMPRTGPVMWLRDLAFLCLCGEGKQEERWANSFLLLKKVGLSFLP
jgi:hypothetical protein